MKIHDKLQMKISIFKKKLVLPGFVLSLWLLLLYNPFKGINVKSFDRTLGNGMLYGIDISKRINNMSFFNFLLVPLTFFFVYLAISILCKNINEKSTECIDFINSISAITLSALIFAHINKFSSTDFLGLEVVLPCVLIMLGIIFLSLNDKKLKLDFNVFKWCIFAAIPITLFAIIMMHKFGITSAMDKYFLLHIDLDTTLSTITNAGLFIIIYIIVFIALFVTVTLLYEEIDFLAMKKAYILVMIAPIVVSLFLELTNILNQYSVFINSKFKMTLIIYLLSYIAFIGYYLFLKSHECFCERFSFEKYYYPILLLGFVLISKQPSLQAIFQTDFFEQSNHGTAVSELFNFGKIPIVETFDAHMLWNEIGNFLYGLFNNDFKGAIFLGYDLLPIFIILYYFLFSKFFNKDISFFLMLLFPITADNTFRAFSLAPIVILSFLYAYKTKKYKGYMIFWTSIAITCLFRLDMGFALAFASIVAWCIVLFVKRDIVPVRKLVLSCLYVVTGGLAIFVGLCLIKGISPVQRLVEFLKLCQSNINWAYNSIGNTTLTAFVLCYFIIPSITAILIIILVLKKWRDEQSVSDNKFIIVLIIGLLCIFNFSRGIVRHSLVEGSNVNIISSAPLFISMLIYIFKKKNKLLSFVVSNVTMMIILSLTINLNSIFPKPLINVAVKKYLTFKPYNTVSLEKTERVIVSDKMKKIYLPLKGVLEKTLLPEETFIDFTNQTLLYAMTEREKPMYINQSPGLLSGEYTQQKFIEECLQMSKKAPFVLMPLEPMLLSNSLDLIQNSYRYYLVSEYISNDFRPLFKTSNFAVWCRKDRFDEKYNLVTKLIEDNLKSYSKVKLTEKNTDILKGYNENVSIVNNELVLKSNSVDPNLIGLDKLMKVKEMQANISSIKLSIEYESDKDGLFELFYTTDVGEEFNSKKVISKTMSKKGTLNATIPYTRDTTIRFDIPEDSTVKVKSVNFKGISDFKEDNILPIDYSYVPIKYHSYDLMNIPYIWANYDKIGIDDKKEQMIINKDSLVYDFSSIDKKHGNYLSVNASSVKDGTMTVQLGKKDKNGFTTLSKFNFSLHTGEKQDYLVRLSSDFMWYSNEINAIKITSDNNSTLDKISILKGDTLK